MAATTAPKGRPTPKRPATPKKKTVAGMPSNEEFHYTTRSGEEVVIPSLAVAEPDVEAIEMLAEALDNKNKFASVRAQMQFIKSVIDPENFALVRKMKISEFQEFIEQWGEWSGVQMGESDAS